MALWILSFFFLLLGLSRISDGSVRFLNDMRGLKVRSDLRRVADTLRELHTRLETGLIPDTAAWESLSELPAPWGRLVGSAVRGLRASGSPVVPTLKRVATLAEEHLESLAFARARVAQSIAQAWVCMGLVPVSALAINLLMPGMRSNQMTWWVLSGFASVWAFGGVVWIMIQADRARWGGIRPARRSWVLASLCAPEALLAGIRTGTPPDLAWGQMMIDLTRNSSELATIWGGSIWDDGGRFEVSNPAERLIARFAVRMKNLIRLSLMEGRPCVDRIEGELSTLRAELRTEIERELQSLGARSLKPLFICVAPAVFGLLILGLFIGSTEMMREY